MTTPDPRAGMVRDDPRGLALVDVAGMAWFVREREKHLAEARQTYRVALARAREDGFAIGEIAQAAGISRQRVHKLLGNGS